MANTETDTKYCPICKQDRPKSDFYKKSSSKDGLQASCKRHTKAAVAKSRAAKAAVEDFQKTPIAEGKMEFFRGLFTNALSKVNDNDSLFISMNNVIAEVTSKLAEAVPGNPSFFHHAPNSDPIVIPPANDEDVIEDQEPRPRKKYEHKTKYLERIAKQKAPVATKKPDIDNVAPIEEVIVKAVAPATITKQDTPIVEAVTKRDIPIADDSGHEKSNTFPEIDPLDMKAIVKAAIKQAPVGGLSATILAAGLVHAKSKEGNWSFDGKTVSYTDDTHKHSSKIADAAGDLISPIDYELEIWVDENRDDVMAKYNKSSGDQKKKYGTLLDHMERIDLRQAEQKIAEKMRKNELIGMFDIKKVQENREIIHKALDIGKKIGAKY